MLKTSSCSPKADAQYMRRALELAAMGRGRVSPNPMVGAVVVSPDGRIIGEGWHRRFGGPHAEVNAITSVPEKDRHIIPQSTVYVTLEPCSHYGKTPPCAELLIREKVRRVVVACGDPNPRVSGRGIRMLREAGIEVCEGILRDEAFALNLPFMTAHTLHRPFVTLKWAQTADGFMDIKRDSGEKALGISSQESSLLVHWRRAAHDAIAVGAGTWLADSPALTTRHISGNNPRIVIFDAHGLIAPDSLSAEAILVPHHNLEQALHELHTQHGIGALLVEGGPGLLKSFIDASLWDEACVETAPICVGEQGSAPAPAIAQMPWKQLVIGQNKVNLYTRGR